MRNFSEDRKSLDLRFYSDACINTWIVGKTVVYCW